MLDIPVFPILLDKHGFLELLGIYGLLILLDINWFLVLQHIAVTAQLVERINNIISETQQYENYV